MLDAPADFLDVVQGPHHRTVWVEPSWWDEAAKKWVLRPALTVVSGTLTVDRTGVAWRRADLRLADSLGAEVLPKASCLDLDMYWGVRLIGEPVEKMRKAKIARLRVQDISVDDDGLLEVAATDPMALVDENDFIFTWTGADIDDKYRVRDVVPNFKTLLEFTNADFIGWLTNDVVLVQDIQTVYRWAGSKWAAVAKTPRTTRGAVTDLIFDCFPAGMYNGVSVDESDVSLEPLMGWNPQVPYKTYPPVPGNAWPVAWGGKRPIPVGSWSTVTDQPSTYGAYPPAYRTTYQWRRTKKFQNVYDYETGFIMQPMFPVQFGEARQGVKVSAWVKLHEGDKVRIGPAVQYGPDAAATMDACPSFLLPEAAQSAAFCPADDGDFYVDKATARKPQVSNSVVLGKKSLGKWRRVEFKVPFPNSKTPDYTVNFARYGLKVTDEATTATSSVRIHDLQIWEYRDTAAITGSPIPASTSFDGSRWEAVSKIAEAAGCEVWFEPDNTFSGGVFKIGSVRPLPEAPDLELYEGLDGAVINLESLWSRRDLYNIVSIATTRLGNFQYVAYDMNTASPTYWRGGYGKRPLVLTNDAIMGSTPGEVRFNLRLAAEAKLRQVGGAAITAKVKAFANPLLTPRDRVDVFLRNGKWIRCRIESLTIDIGEGTMDLSLREWVE